MRRTLALVLLAALAACSSGDDDDSAAAANASATTAPVKPCEEVYAEGRPTADVMADTQCMDGDVLMAVALAALPCPDGRSLHWDDNGWGYNDGTWAHHARPDGQLVPPQADYDACNV